MGFASWQGSSSRSIPETDPNPNTPTAKPLTFMVGPKQGLWEEDASAASPALRESLIHQIFVAFERMKVDW